MPMAQAGGGCWELAGLPEGDEVFEAGEQAGEGGEDEGVQRRDHARLGGAVFGCGVQVGGDTGDLDGQGGRDGHVCIITNCLYRCKGIRAGCLGVGGGAMPKRIAPL